MNYSNPNHNKTLRHKLKNVKISYNIYMVTNGAIYKGIYKSTLV